MLKIVRPIARAVTPVIENDLHYVIRGQEPF